MDFALNDENIPPPDENIPSAIIGRQRKRVKLAEDLAAVGAVQDEVIGEREIKVTDICLKKLVGNPEENGVLFAVLNAAIERACAVGGAIQRIMDLQETRIQRTLDLQETRTEARYYNGLVTARDRHIEPLPNIRGEVNKDFPENLGAFWSMKSQTVINLLQHYGLPNNGQHPQRFARLARYCRIQIPVD